jgi:nucleoside-diphosphate kinase
MLGMSQRTLSIIKPDATTRNLIGKILAHFEAAGLKIVAARMATLTPEEAGEFYAVHKERPFYGELVDYMVSGPVFISVLEGTDAVNLNRKLMGATDPKKADAGTIRALYAESIAANAVHGSDSLENAATEIKFFFPNLK